MVKVYRGSFAEVSLVQNNIKYTTAGLKAAAKLNKKHKHLLEQSGEACCYFCLSYYPSSDITTWLDKRGETGTTALCPKCGIDSVLPNSLTLDEQGNKIQTYPLSFLKKMRKYWFS